MSNQENSNLLLKHAYLEGEKKIAGNGKTCWQNCRPIRRILDYIIGSHTNTVHVSINDFEII